jgi:hypothetical protein
MQRWGKFYFDLLYPPGPNGRRRAMLRLGALWFQSLGARGAPYRCLDKEIAVLSESVRQTVSTLSVVIFLWNFKTWCSTTWWVSMSCLQEPHPWPCELPNVSEWLMLLIQHLQKLCCLGSFCVFWRISWCITSSRAVSGCGLAWRLHWL